MRPRHVMRDFLRNLLRPAFPHAPLGPHACAQRSTSPPPSLVPPQATVFALYDEARCLQYVGFSRGLRDSLRTLFSRRPDKAHAFK